MFDKIKSNLQKPKIMYPVVASVCTIFGFSLPPELALIFA
jgi:hypothetical protein